MARVTFFLLATVLFSQSVSAQDTLVSRDNTIKLDITSRFFFNDSYVLSYERYMKTRQTAGVTFGYHTFPSLRTIGNGTQVKEDKSSSGYVAAGEYRFYLEKENRYAAPRGVFMGPYVAYHNFKNSRDISIVNDDGTLSAALLNTNINILNIGFEVGYQFIINQRWSLDVVVVGPSFSYYKINMDIDGNIDPSALPEKQQEILLALADRFPFVKDLLEGETVSASGKADTWAYGYRYQLQVGYHFGRKKNRH